MRRSLLLVIAGVAITLLVSPSVATAQAPAGDTAAGSGDVFIPTPIPDRQFHLFGFDFDAVSGPRGENPTGQISRLTSGERAGFLGFTGTVTCLAVSGNRAAIGAVGTLIPFGGSGSALVTVVDGGPANSGADSFNALFGFFGGLPPTPPNCSTASFANQHVVTNGDIAVHHAPALPTSKDQCKNGGWQNFGVFKNQGDCVSFVETGGENPPDGLP